MHMAPRLQLVHPSPIILQFRLLLQLKARLFPKSLPLRLQLPQPSFIAGQLGLAPQVKLSVGTRGRCVFVRRSGGGKLSPSMCQPGESPEYGEYE